MKGAIGTDYGFLFDKLVIVELLVSEIRNISTPDANLPGVYVHYSPSLGFVKVGKSQNNSRTRSIDHLHDNTKTRDKKYGMAQLNNETGAKIFLFNVRSREDIHWLLGLEYYMEEKLKPLIASDRRG